MMDFSFETIAVFAAGIFCGSLAVYGIMAARLREMRVRLDVEKQMQANLADRFAALSAEALSRNNEQFLTLANENLQRFHQKADASLHEKQTAIAELLKPVADSLQKMDHKIADIETRREGAYAELKTLVGSMKEQHQLLQHQTSSLTQALRAPTSRGQWGEMQLKRVLDFSGLLEGVHYTRQPNVTGMRPDILVQLPPEKVLLIDSKVPMQNYLSAMQPDVSDSDKNLLLTKHANDLKAHIKALSAKEYTQGFNSFDWVVMFVPLDGLIQMAMDKMPDLVEYAWSRNVVLATPTNLLGLMRTVSYAHDQFKVNENAKEIASLAEVLYQRIQIFAEHFDKMGRGLSTALNSYNQAVGSLERNVMTGLRRLKEAGVKAGDRDVRLEPIDEVPRVLTSPELLERAENQ